MIKGVNKKVIEINRPDSAYFERAVLYLKPDVSEAAICAVQAEAEELLTTRKNRSPRGLLLGWGLFLLGMLTSAAGCVLVLLLL